MGLMLTIIVLCVVLGVPGTLIWWKLADKWADAEHKRFPIRPDRRGATTVPGPEPTVVDFQDSEKR